MRPYRLLAFPIFAAAVTAADLPVREVILYKHGVGYFERAGELKPGDVARLDFKAGDMNDVLKSLTIRGAARVSGVRYDASEPLARRLESFPFRLEEGASLASFLDQMKGARLELRLGPDTVAGAIVSARAIRGADPNRPVERETVVLLTDSGEIRTFDLGAASSVKLSDAKLQDLLKDYLAVLGGARSRDRRSLVIEAQGPASGQIAASYLTPAAVWKSSYRLVFGREPQPLLEGWAIVDNTSGEDWTNVKLSVVSGRPISFITQLYEPRYVDRPRAELAENRPVGPVVFEGALSEAAQAPALARAALPPPPPKPAFRTENRFGAGVGSDVAAPVAAESSIASTAQGRDLGELFEYSFETPVTVKQGESAMLPFLQQRVNARKLLIYSERFGLHPMNAAEIANSTGKTLDGGPITVYDASAYAGEALVETLKSGDKRLISYGIDLGTRISTAWDSSRANVREIHFARGVLTTRNSVVETKTYTIRNVDAMAKTVIIEHPLREGFKLTEIKPLETTSNAYRFEVKVGASATETFAVKEERVYDQTISVATMTPDVLATWIQNRALSANGRRQLEQIAAKKRELAASDAEIRQTQTDLANISQDQDRLRRNLESLRNIAGQQELVQQYARQLAESEAKLAGLRDRETQLRRARAAQEADVNALLEKIEF
jgi:hypothetical protein